MFDQEERVREEEECQPYGCLCTRWLKHDQEAACCDGFLKDRTDTRHRAKGNLISNFVQSVLEKLDWES